VKETYVIEVRRDSLLHDAVKSVQRKSFSPLKTIMVNKLLCVHDLLLQHRHRLLGNQYWMEEGLHESCGPF